MFDYIERFYNPQRCHSTIGYVSPVEFEKMAAVRCMRCTATPSRLRGRLTARRNVEPCLVVIDLIAPPSWLTETQASIWRRVVAEAPPGVLRACDRGRLSVWVVASDIHEQASVAQNAAGQLVQRTGKVSPLIRIVNAQAMVMIRCAQEMGFSPTSRPRLMPARASTSTTH